MPRPTFVIDSREKRPYSLSPSRTAALPFGDYSVSGLERRVAIERKSLEDLFGSFTSTRRRMMIRLDELATLDYAALLVEASPSQIVAGSAYSKVNGRSLLRTVSMECAERGLSLVLARSRREARVFAREFLAGAHDRIVTGRASARRCSSFDARRARVYGG